MKIPKQPVAIKTAYIGVFDEVKSDSYFEVKNDLLMLFFMHTVNALSGQ